MSRADLIELGKETWQEFNEDKAPRLAAALAYYTLFSLAPLLVVVIAVAGLTFGEEAARGQIVGAISGIVGQLGAEAIETMIEGASNQSTGILATVIGLATLLLGASGVFGELQESLNTIWEVTDKPGKGILGMLKDRFFSFTLVLGTGFLLLVSMVVTAGLQAFGDYIAGFMPGGDIFLNILNFIISFAITTVLFALLYKIVPDVEITWRDVWIGAAATALLFSIGRIAIGFYLARSAAASTYGAAGSLVIVILWIYYSSLILFLGAEFTQVYARRFGSRVKPAEDAVPMTEKARIEQGMPRHPDVRVADKTEQSVEAVAVKREAQADGDTQAQETAPAKDQRPARQPDETSGHVTASAIVPLKAEGMPKAGRRPSPGLIAAGLLTLGVISMLGRNSLRQRQSDRR